MHCNLKCDSTCLLMFHVVYSIIKLNSYYLFFIYHFNQQFSSAIAVGIHCVACILRNGSIIINCVYMS